MKCAECGAPVTVVTEVCAECGAPPVGQRPAAADPVAAGRGDGPETAPGAVGDTGQPTAQSRPRLRYFLTCLVFFLMIIGSLGFLAFAPFLWLALIRQRTRDWAVFAVYLAALLTAYYLIGYPVDSTAGNIGGWMLLVLGAIGAVYTLVAYHPEAGPTTFREARAARVAREHQEHVTGVATLKDLWTTTGRRRR